jgi:hypothetical protein
MVANVNAGLFTSGVSSLGTAASDIFTAEYTAPAEQAAAQAQVAMANASAQADILQGQGDILCGAGRIECRRHSAARFDHRSRI